ncbi:TorF family putative porin [Duganella callida]|uniref:TorF family putative porin n=1 Tax=Duganella callida TaxID=2561932 RepID=UPI001E3A49F4|nr:TorF family putative porin [Duganella callida]
MKRAVAASLLWLLQPAAGAQADISGSVALQSEYSYRGQAPGDGGAVPQLTLNVDTVSGWYVGGFASGVHIGDNHGYKLQAYAGYARRMASGLSWEAGCNHNSYTQAHVYDFQECYGGLSGERFSARLYYAPRYFGYHSRVLYAEGNYFHPLTERINLVAHGGLLYNVRGDAWPGIPRRARYDVRLGIAVPVGNWTLQAARQYSPDDDTWYPPYPVHSAKAWTWSASYAF